MRLLLVAFLIFLSTGRCSFSVEHLKLTPNPGYSRDLSMGASTAALSYPAQSASINPAGLTLAPDKSQQRWVLIVNPAGGWQLKNYFSGEHESRPTIERISESARLLMRGVGFRYYSFSAMMTFADPVMLSDSSEMFIDYAETSGLQSHRNSVTAVLNLHPRVSLGGQIDRYYNYSKPHGEGYSYGLILRPKVVDIGFQYQKFPASGEWIQHFLDRRRDESISVGVATGTPTFTTAFQLTNVTQSNRSAFLEPHAGCEWRPLRAVALRAGGTAFSRSQTWAWTAGAGLIDANWLRPRSNRLAVPDDVIQFAVANVYQKRQLTSVISSLTCSWRF